MSLRPIRNVVILGGGTAGWMTAALLARFLGPQGVVIRLVESDEIGIIGVGEATVPLMQIFNGVLGIDEREFLRQTQGTIKLGIEFRDWLRPGSSHFHFFGDLGDAIEGIAPHHHWLKLRQLGDTTPLGEYSLPYMMGKLGRFVPPDPRVAAAAYKYAYHFDASLYARFLRSYAESRGVRRTEGRLGEVRLRPADGFIEALLLESAERIDGELFIDCSGFRGLLIEQALHTGYEEWTRWLPCDRAAAVPCAKVDVPTPYTISTAREAGWQWRIPLQHRTGNGYVYCSQYLSEDRAASALLDNLDGAALSEPRTLRFVTGRRRKFWNRNCVAVGLAGGFMEPLESTSIQLIQTAIVRLIDLFPDTGFDPKISDEYNRICANEYERIRDFIILHYAANGRDDTPLWRHCRNMPLPDTLQYKIELFKATAKVALYSEESYQEPSWVSILLGQEVFPDRYDPIVDNLDVKRLALGMQQRRTAIRKLVEAMPSHAEFIARHCAAAAA